MNLLIGALTMGLILSLLALGVLITFRVLRTLDLTADGAFGVGAAVSAALLVRGSSPLVATAGGVLAGMLAGAASALTQTRLRVDPLLAGILTSTAFYSVMLYVMRGGDLSVSGRPTLFTWAERLWGWAAAPRAPLGVSAANWAALAFVLALVVLVAAALRGFFGTRAGLAMRAAGDEPRMARAQGIAVGGAVALGLILANGLVGLSGALFAQFQGFANVQMTVGMFVTGLACVVLGEAFGTRGVSRLIAGAIAGTVVFRLLVSAALRMGLDPNATKLATAALVLAVLALPNVVRRAGALRHAGAPNA
jgi:putative tryptophan/tyrosine transport system permease protein